MIVDYEKILSADHRLQEPIKSMSRKIYVEDLQGIEAARTQSNVFTWFCSELNKALFIK